MPKPKRSAVLQYFKKDVYFVESVVNTTEIVPGSCLTNSKVDQLIENGTTITVKMRKPLK